MSILSIILTLLLPSLGILALFIIGAILLRKWVVPTITKYAEKKNLSYVAILIEAFTTPVYYLLVFLGFYYAITTALVGVSFLGFVAFILSFLEAIKGLFMVYVLISGCLHATKLIPLVMQSYQERTGHAITQTLVMFLTRIAQIVIIAFGVVMALSELNYNVTGLIAGLGLGGLTLALAAQDAASNFFAGFTIIAEHPFDVGDWISAGGVEGSVEEITLRSTKVRTVENTLTIVPNSTLCAGAITNWTRMNMRLARITIGLTYSTASETMQDIISDINTMLIDHEEVVSDTVQVQFAEFGSSSLDVYMQFYTVPTQIPEHRRVKADVNFKIIGIVEKHGASFAYPTNSIYFQNELKTALPTAE